MRVLKSVFTALTVLHTLALLADMSFHVDEDVTKALVTDTDFLHMTGDMIPEFKKLLSEWEPKRDLTITTLKGIKKDIEESYDKRTKAKVAGASAAVVGSGLAIVGFGLGFVTFGASLGLTIVGSTLAAAGGLTMGGSDLGYFAVSKSKKKVVQDLVNQDRELSEKVRKKGAEIRDCVNTLSEKYPAIPEEKIFAIAAEVVEYGKLVKTGMKIVYDSYKAVDSVIDIARVVYRTANVVSGSANAAQIAFAGLNTAAGVFSIAGCVVDVLALPLDILVIAKGAYDIHKYRTGEGSNSNAAERIANDIKGLEQDKEDVLKMKTFLTATRLTLRK